MISHLISLLLLASSFSLASGANLTFNLTTDGNSWLVAGITGPDPDLNASVGDMLTFNVMGLPTTVFAIHRTQNSTDPTDRADSMPVSINGSGTLTLTIDSTLGGKILIYEDESSATTLFGRICIMMEWCTTMDKCGGLCTACSQGYAITAGGTCVLNMMNQTNSTNPPPAGQPPSGQPPAGQPPAGQPPSGQPPATQPPSGNGCTPPANCKTASCWASNDVQCTECNRGFWISNSNFDPTTNSSSPPCTACSTCADREYISWPCEGYTDTVCSACYSDACGPCQVGYTLDLYGQCNPQLCMLYGCGAADLDVVCREYDSKHFLCVCPVEKVTIVQVNGTAFVGCSATGGNNGTNSSGGNSTGGGGTGPTNEQIVAHVNASHLEAFLINGMEKILGVALIDVNGNSFTLNITATVPIDGLTAELQKQIAKFLGGSFTPEDISVDYIGKRRKRASNGQVVVSVNGGTSGGNHLLVPSTTFFALLLAMLALR